jgi:hypothetical protein
MEGESDGGSKCKRGNINEKARRQKEKKIEIILFV